MMNTSYERNIFNQETEDDGSNREELQKLQEYLSDPNCYKNLCRDLSARVLGQTKLGDFCCAIFAFLKSVAAGTPRKHNILLAGPSGSGKSELCRALKDALKDHGVDVVMVDSSSITESGFKGTEPYELFRPFIDKKRKAPIGILVADELDKRIKPSCDSTGRNANRAVLEQLLVALEGGCIPAGKGNELDTSNILIIGAGAFSYVREERAEEKVIGFAHDDAQKELAKCRNAYYELTLQDIQQAGAFPEFLGRFDTIVQMRALGKNDFHTLLMRHVDKLQNDQHCKIVLSAEYEDAAFERFLVSPMGCRSIYSELWGKLLPHFHEINMNAYDNAVITVDDEQKISMSYDEDEAMTRQI